MRPGTSRTKPVRHLTRSKEREGGSPPRAGRHVRAGPGPRFPPKPFPRLWTPRLCGWGVCGGRVLLLVVVDCSMVLRPPRLPRPLRGGGWGVG